MPPVETVHVAGPSRRDPAWLWILAGVLLAARVALGIYENRHPPLLPDLVSWVPAEQAAARAATQRRPILYDFTAEWCGPCQRMRAEVFSDEKMANSISRLVVPVQVVDRTKEDGRNSALVDSLQRAHGVDAFPTLVVVGADGKALDRLEGFPGTQELMSWIGRASVKQQLSTQGGASLRFP